MVLFLLTLPLSNPWVRGDGVGYYAFARSLLIEHRLDFQRDRLEANQEFRLAHTDAEGQIPPAGYTAPGHVTIIFRSGLRFFGRPSLSSIMRAFRFVTRSELMWPLTVFSKRYVISMAFATAIYGFLALWISFQGARR